MTTYTVIDTKPASFRPRKWKYDNDTGIAFDPKFTDTTHSALDQPKIAQSADHLKNVGQITTNTLSFYDSLDLDEDRYQILQVELKAKDWSEDGIIDMRDVTSVKKIN